MKMEELPVTEISSQFTRGLDRVEEGCEGVVRMLRQADGQLWAGFGPHAAIYDEPILDSLGQLARCFRQVVESSHAAGEPRTVAVLSGCGTSGRMAYFATCLFNSYLPGAEELPPCQRPFRYLISGGDHSLVLSQELPEDDPSAGVRDLEECIKDLTEGSTIVVVGVTCGISAPYVLGQLQHALRSSSAARRFIPALVGFNPTHLARNSPVEGWTSTCRDVAQRLEEAARSHPGSAIVLNPVLGPEAVTGSSRMKGGSATKILLDTAFFTALAGEGDSSALTSVLAEYERVHRRAYLPVRTLALAMRTVGQSLRAGGHLYYVAAGAVGRMGFIDASEMYDTYGQDPRTVQGFMRDGWTAAATNTGDLSPAHELLRLSWEDFCTLVLPKLSSSDTVVFASTPAACQDAAWLAEAIAAVGVTDAHIVRIRVRQEGSEKEVDSLGSSPCVATAVDVDVELCRVDFSDRIDAAKVGPCPLADLAVKYIFNAISTAACVVKGLVYSNRMINMGISNNKLFFRAVRIIQDVASVDEATARESLLRAIHGIDSEEVRRRMIDDEEWRAISHHVVVATPKPQVLPHAILLASDSRLSYAQAHEALEREPLLRAHIPPA